MGWGGAGGARGDHSTVAVSHVIGWDVGGANVKAAAVAPTAMPRGC